MEALARLTKNGTSSDMEGSSLRTVVVYDRQSNSGAIPNYNVIFGQTDQAGTETGTVLDSLRYDNTGRFSVLMDKVITANPLTMGGAAANDFVDQHYYCDEYLKLKNLETFYSDTANPATNTEISTGSLYIYFRATLDSAALAQWSVRANSFARLRYYD